MLSSAIKISVSKESPIPVRDQIIEQIGLQIASGTLKGKDKLPSIRALAQKLGIHHSTVTAAYNHLADAGLLEIRQGSGVRVASRSVGAAEPTKDTSAEQLFKSFLAQSAESGMSREDVKSCIGRLLKSEPVKRILVVDRNQDFHPLLLAELQPHFNVPVKPVTFQELSKQTELLADSLIVTSFYHLYPLQSLPLDPTRLVVCTVEPGREEMEAIQTVKAGSIVAFVSISQTLLRMATNMAAALRGEEVAVRSMLLSDETEIAYMMKYAAVVICDGPSENAVRGLAGKVPVQAFHLYSPATKDLIAQRLAKWG